MDRIRLLRCVFSFLLSLFSPLMNVQNCEFTMIIMQRETLQILAHFASPFSFERRYQNSLCRSTLHRCKHDSPWPCEWSANAKMQNSQVRRGKALLVFFFSTDGCAIYLSAKSKQRMGLKTSWKDEKLHNNENLLIVSGRIFFSFDHERFDYIREKVQKRTPH